MQLSIIIPVYNTEDYISDCLESVISQGIKDIEIIVIDDGSTDNSASIINQFDKDFPGQLIYRYQENQGQGAARNHGISLATGEYIYFMDSDDILSPGFIDGILTEAKKMSLDAVFFDGDSFIDDNYKSNNDFFPDYIRDREYGNYAKGSSLLRDLYENRDFIVSPCLYILKTDVIKKYNLFFPEGIKLEDEYFTIKMMLCIGRCKHIKSIGFYRRIRANSTMTSSSNMVKLESILKLVELFDDLYSNFNFDSVDSANIIRNRVEVFYKLGITYIRRIKLNTDEFRQKNKYLNNYARKYNYFSNKTKLFILLTKNMRIYDFITKIRNNKLI